MTKIKGTYCMAQQTQQMTPMMKQYWEIKSRYPDKDTILFFRLGDFYEMFFEDAEVASKILDIALTSRNKNSDNPVPLCGIPFHSAYNYISKLLAGGKKIAICEQVEDPKEAKGIVRRDVIRVITPGTIIEPENLEARRNNFLAAVNLFKEKYGFAFIDVTTGLFKVTEFQNIKDLKDEISRLEPTELLISQSLAGTDFRENFRMFQSMLITVLDDPRFDSDHFSHSRAEFKCHPEPDSGSNSGSLRFRIKSGMKDGIPDSAKAAAGAIINYVEYTAKEVTNQISSIEVYKSTGSMVIDESTKRNLELTKTMIDGTRHGSLLWLLDQTVTPMGARMIREWLLHPLRDLTAIRERHEAVGSLCNDVILSDEISTILSNVSDIERTAGRLAMETANARDLISLKTSLKALPYLAEIKRKVTGLLKDILEKIDPLENVVESIERAIVEEPPLGIRDGGIIKEGFGPELDELRQISREGKGFIARLEAAERKKTGISSLKVRYNRVFGYYIEVTHTHKDKIPADYIRKQTLTNAERFITQELKEFEEKVLGAEERIKAIELDIFIKLRRDLAANVGSLKKTANLLARLDSILSLATVARNNRYVKPEVTDSSGLEIKEGRHPIIEKLNTTDRFVPNDTLLDDKENRLLIITGPNMAGKSTVMRQVALIVLMAQMGSFVPAASAKIGLTDRIFTRVGASDNIMRGQSTFMVEMQEAAAILTEATEKSLIIIDEIGRGTSTFDGVAIAWAVAEFIHDKIRAKTLFATHYHELTDLVLTKSAAKNFNIAVKEWAGKIIFLHKLVSGGVSHSYGIQVADLAGLPRPVIERAREVLANLESGELDEVGLPTLAHSKGEKRENRGENINQLQLFNSSNSNKIVEELKNANLDVMTPIEALNFIHKLRGQSS